MSCPDLDWYVDDGGLEPDELVRRWFLRATLAGFPTVVLAVVYNNCAYEVMHAWQDQVYATFPTLDEAQRFAEAHYALSKT